MKQSLTKEQLSQVIAEVQRLSDYKNDHLIEADEVQQILQELDLPSESLEEALIQVQRRKRMQQDNRQQKRFVGAAIALISLAIAVPLCLFWQNQQSISQVSVQHDRVTFAQDNGIHESAIERQSRPEVFYRVTLKDSPVGRKLALTCHWLDPSKQVMKQNQYETKLITTSVWSTHCRHQLEATAPLGTWMVRMFLDGREISNEVFQVK